MIKETSEVIKGPEKVDEFLSTLFKALDRQKSKDERKSVEKKVVVRRLPPTMTEERFLNEVSPLPEFNYMYFVPGDPNTVPFHHSRVYINFVKEEDMYMFTNKFNCYVFVDDSGDEYPAVVELAPYQRIPKKNLDKDPNWGKIHENPVFLEFKHNFEQKTIDTTLKTTQHFFESVEDKSQEQDCSTPLLEYLAKQNDRQRIRVNQRDERRKKVFIRKHEKEDIRRNKKVEKEIFIKPKSMTKSSSPISRRVIEEKPVKDISQKKIIKSHKEDIDFFDEKKKYYDENYKVKNEDVSKVDDVKKIEFKLKTSRLNNSNKYFENDLRDEITSKPEKNNEDDSKEDSKIQKKIEILKPKYSEIKTSELSKHNKPHEDKESEIKISGSIKHNKLNDEKESEIKTSGSSKYNKLYEEESEIKTSGSTKHNKTHEDRESEIKTSVSSKHNKPLDDKEFVETENHIKDQFDADLNVVSSKRIENRRQDIKNDRRIRNKDRPAIEIYRPGMGRLSKLKAENDGVQSELK